MHSQGDGRGLSSAGARYGAIAESGRLCSAPWIARVTGSKLALAGQVASMPQAIFAGDMQSVSAIGPSSASTISATEIRSAGRASPYPP